MGCGSMEKSTFLFVAAVILEMVGFGAAVSQVGVFLDYRRLSRLARFGVETEALAKSQEYAGAGNYRVSYEIRVDAVNSKVEFRDIRRGEAVLGSVVAVVYDRRNPRRGRTGFLEDIDYRAEKLAVFCFGYGGLVLFCFRCRVAYCGLTGGCTRSFQ